MPSHWVSMFRGKNVTNVFFLCPSFISITTNNQKKIEIKRNMTDPERSKSWILFAYCHYTHWCHTNRADQIHKWQEQYHQNSFTIIMLTSYTEIYQVYKYQMLAGIQFGWNTDQSLMVWSVNPSPKRRDLLQSVKDWVSYAIQHQTCGCLPM